MTAGRNKLRPLAKPLSPTALVVFVRGLAEKRRVFAVGAATGLSGVAALAQPALPPKARQRLATDYHTGSGRSAFLYDVLLQGPEVGLTIHF
jgi:hypothetical protein